MTGTEIYLDHQATTPCAPSVVDAMASFWAAEFGNPHSSAHAFGWRAEDAVTAARERVAELIGAEREEIVFTSGATEANNLAFLGLLGSEIADGRNVVVSAAEHKCVLQSARQLQRNGFEVRKAPISASGHVDLEALATLIDARTALVSVMMVNNEIGTLQPIAAISGICRRVDAVFHCDAAQALTAIHIDVEELGVDLLSLSSHKMYGPKGIGALFVSHAVRQRIRPIIHGGGQEGGLRSGTLPTPLCVGFGEAARVVRARLHDDIAHLSRSRQAFLDVLHVRVPDAMINGAEPRHPGHLNLRFPGVDAEIIGRQSSAPSCRVHGCRVFFGHPGAVPRSEGDRTRWRGGGRMCPIRFRSIHGCRDRARSGLDCCQSDRGYPFELGCRSSVRHLGIRLMSCGDTRNPKSDRSSKQATVLRIGSSSRYRWLRSGL